MRTMHFALPISAVLNLNYNALGLAVRTDSALQRNQYGGAHPDILADLPAKDLLDWDRAGEETYKDLARKLMRNFIFPSWLPEISRTFRYPEAEMWADEIIHELAPQGWDYLAEPYSRNEFWMLERVLADLDHGRIAYKLVRSIANGPIRVFCRELVLGPYGDEEEFRHFENALTIPALS
jgi:hypothetical protein